MTKGIKSNGDESSEKSKEKAFFNGKFGFENDDVAGENRDIPLLDATDNDILMHRDAHFGGKFEFMLDYYRLEGKGIREDFSLERILYLAELEKQLGQNLAAMLLSGAEAEKIAKAKESYKALRDLYELSGSQKKYPKLIADLILAEKEDLVRAIAAVVAEKGAIVPALIDLVRAEDFYDPLFPGYGEAPFLAAQCLAQIGDKRAIIALFEMIGSGDFFADDLVLDAMQSIGEPARLFLLRVVKGLPWNVDNERAAMALIRFKDDKDVAETCLQLLQDPEVRQHIPLATYLILVCEGLTDPQQRAEFLHLADHPKTPRMLKNDILAVGHTWSK